MRIKGIVIEGANGEVTINRTFSGATVVVNHDIVCEVGRQEDREARLVKALRAAEFVYGRSKRGGPNATNSMVHDVLDAIDRVAGC